MMRFRVRNVIPPGGRYFYVVPETSVRIESLSYSVLFDLIRQHYGRNNLAAPMNLADVVEDYMCRNLPNGFCFGDPEGRPVSRSVTLSQIKENTKRLVSGNKFVFPGEARRRADICGRCPLNDRSVCTTCVGLHAWSRKLVGQTVGGAAEWLGVCAVDAVSLSAKVHVTDVPSNPDYPINCWRKSNVAS